MLEPIPAKREHRLSPSLRGPVLALAQTAETEMYSGENATLAGRRETLSKPRYEQFSARTMWSLSNAFTSAFKELDPIPQFKATAKLGEFLPNTATAAR